MNLDLKHRKENNMEIPNKVYLEVLPHSNPKEVYKDVLKTKRTFEDDIEYIRTDAFIDKACDWMSNHLQNEYESFSDFIKAFKKVMK